MVVLKQHVKKPNNFSSNLGDHSKDFLILAPQAALIKNWL